MYISYLTVFNFGIDVIMSTNFTLIDCVVHINDLLISNSRALEYEHLARQWRSDIERLSPNNTVIVITGRSFHIEGVCDVGSATTISMILSAISPHYVTRILDDSQDAPMLTLLCKAFINVEVISKSGFYSYRNLRIMFDGSRDHERGTKYVDSTQGITQRSFINGLVSIYYGVESGSSSTSSDRIFDIVLDGTQSFAQHNFEAWSVDARDIFKDTREVRRAIFKVDISYGQLHIRLRDNAMIHDVSQEPRIASSYLLTHLRCTPEYIQEVHDTYCHKWNLPAIPIMEDMCSAVDDVIAPADDSAADAAEIDTYISDLYTTDTQERMLMAFAETLPARYVATNAEVLALHRRYFDAAAMKDVSGATRSRWRIKSLAWSNLHNYGPDRSYIDFKDRDVLYGLFSKNGAGKTSIIDALLIVLYNKPLQILRGARRTGSDRFYIEAILEVPRECAPDGRDARDDKSESNGGAAYESNSAPSGAAYESNSAPSGAAYESNSAPSGAAYDEYSISRTDLKSVIFTTPTDEKKGTPKDVYPHIEKVLGSYNDAVVTFIMRQRTMDDFVFMEPTARKRLLEKLFGLDLFTSAHKAARDELVLVKKEYNSYTQRAPVETRDQLRAIVEQRKHDIIESNKELVAAHAELELCHESVNASELATDSAWSKLSSRELRKEIVQRQTSMTCDAKTLVALAQEHADIMSEKDDGPVREYKRAIQQHRLRELQQVIQIGNTLIGAATGAASIDVSGLARYMKELNGDAILAAYDKWSGDRLKRASMIKQVLDYAAETKQMSVVYDARMKRQSRAAAKKSAATRLQSASIHIKVAVDALKTSETRLREYDTFVKQYTDLYTRLHALKKYVRCVDDKNGLPLRALNKVLIKFNREMFEITRRLNMPQIAAYISKDALQVDMKTNLGLVPIRSGSGSECDRASLTVRICLCRMLPRPLGDFILLDEGFTSLDARSLAVVSEFISVIKKSGYFSFIGLISHHDSLNKIADIDLRIRHDSGYAFCEYGQSPCALVHEDIKASKKASVSSAIEPGSDTWHCDLCSKTIKKNSQVRHIASAFHIKRLRSLYDTRIQP
jgi:hypothetical protein